MRRTTDNNSHKREPLIPAHKQIQNNPRRAADNHSAKQRCPPLENQIADVFVSAHVHATEDGEGYDDAAEDERDGGVEEVYEGHGDEADEDEGDEVAEAGGDGGGDVIWEEQVSGDGWEEYERV